MSVIFRDPPPLYPGNRRTSKWARVANELRENSGKWAYVGELASGIASNINKGRINAFPLGEFEATSRSTSNRGKADIYVRHIPRDQL